MFTVLNEFLKMQQWKFSEMCFWGHWLTSQHHLKKWLGANKATGHYLVIDKWLHVASLGHSGWISIWLSSMFFQVVLIWKYCITQNAHPLRERSDSLTFLQRAHVILVATTGGASACSLATGSSGGGGKKHCSPVPCTCASVMVVTWEWSAGLRERGTYSEKKKWTGSKNYRSKPTWRKLNLENVVYTTRITEWYGSCQIDILLQMV